MSKSSRLRSTSPFIVAAVAVLVLASCAADASTRGDTTGGSTTTAAVVTAARSVPAGTTLHVGDQLDYLKTILSVSGQDKDLPYKVEYANFIGGPPMLQAFKGGAIDAGFVASTPLIFAQAAHQQIVAVAGWAAVQGLGGLISADPDIKTWKDLKGKRVAYQRGTSAEAAVLTALDKAGLSPRDITTVDVPLTQVAATIKGGSADAGVSTEPLISKFLTDTPDGHVVAKADDITDRGSFLIASKDALDDEPRSAALSDYITRLVKAWGWLANNKEALANSVFVKQYGLTSDRALELVAATGRTAFLTLPGDIAKPQQELADRFHEAGQIPATIDTSSEFDPRFNALVEAAAAKKEVSQ